MSALSVSRVGGKTQAPALREVAGTLRLDYAQFLELEMFTRFGGVPDARVRAQLRRGERLRALLAQPRNAPLRLADEVALALALRDGCLDAVPPDAIAALRRDLPDWLDTHARALPSRRSSAQSPRSGAAAALGDAVAALAARHAEPARMTERLADIGARIRGVRQLETVISAMRSIAAARAQQSRSLMEGVDAHAGVVAQAIAEALHLLPEGLPPAAGRARRGGSGAVLRRTGFCRRLYIPPAGRGCPDGWSGAPVPRFFWSAAAARRWLSSGSSRSPGTRPWHRMPTAFRRWPAASPARCSTTCRATGWGGSTCCSPSGRRDAGWKSVAAPCCRWTEAPLGGAPRHSAADHAARCRCCWRGSPRNTSMPNSAAPPCTPLWPRTRSRVQTLAAARSNITTMLGRLQARERRVRQDTITAEVVELGAATESLRRAPPAARSRV